MNRARRVLSVAGRLSIGGGLLALALLWQPSFVFGVTCNTWDGTTGNWVTDTTKWSAGHFPTSGEDACLPAGSYIVTVDSTAQVAKSLDIGANVTLKILGDAGDTTLQITNGVTNAGTIQIGKSPSHANNAALNAATVTNTGTINVPGTGSNGLNADIDNQSTGTINSTGSLGMSRTNLQITNNGTWHVGGQVDVSSTPTLTIAGGTIDGGSIFLSAGGTIDHTGGTVTANVVLNSGTIKPRSSTGGGTFLVTRTGNILATDIAIGETVVVAGGYVGQHGELTSSTSRANNGTIILRTDGSLQTSKILFSGGATLTNNGTISSANPNLQNGPDRVIQASLINNGTINVLYPLDFSLGGAAILQNSGNTNLQSTLDMTGSFGTLILSGGTLTGAGTLIGNVQNDAGTVSPGSSPGVLTVTGNFTQAAGGTLAIEIDGNTAGSTADRLAISGNASLNGTLLLSRPNLFVPTLSYSYEYITFVSHGGNFSVVSGTNAGGGKTFVSTLTTGGGTLTVVGGGTFRQPDGKIALGTGPLVGNDIYGTDGFGQSRFKQAGKGVTVKFTIKLQNDGNKKDKFNVAATGADNTGFTFTCKKGTADITNAVNVGAFNTNDIAAGSSVTITCSVKIGKAALHLSQVGKLLTITSLNDSNQKDAVQLVVQRS